MKLCKAEATLGSLRSPIFLSFVFRTLSPGNLFASQAIGHLARKIEINWYLSRAVHITSWTTDTVFIPLNAAAFIKFLVIQVRRLFEGGVYTRAAFI